MLRPPPSTQGRRTILWNTTPLVHHSPQFQKDVFTEDAPPLSLQCNSSVDGSAAAAATTIATFAKRFLWPWCLKHLAFMVHFPSADVVFNIFRCWLFFSALHYSKIEFCQEVMHLKGNGAVACIVLIARHSCCKGEKRKKDFATYWIGINRRLLPVH